jgi:hypothetical protein
VSDERDHPVDEDQPTFIGTLFVVMVIIMLTVGLWTAVYLTLLGR